MNNTYDLTGADPDFLRSDRRFMVFSANQIVSFGEPAFAESVRVYQIIDNLPTELTKDVDWRITVGNKDITAISEAKIRDSEFSANLINSILMIKTPSPQYQISVTYQGFVLDAAAYTGTGNGPTYTPGLMLSVIKKLEFLLNVKNPVTNVTSELLTALRVLDTDLTGILPANFIQEEFHSVNVPNGRFIIRPQCGSFYKEGVVIRLVSNNAILVEDTDYKIIGVNHGKTKLSTPQCGVYDYIQLLTPIVGDIKVAYHAFGGEVTPVDINNIRTILISILSLLNDGEFLTVKTLDDTDIIKSLKERIADLEELFRHYPIDSFYAPCDDEESWVNIANIAHGPWSEIGPVESLGYGQFKLEIPSVGYTVEFSLKYNTDATKPLSVNIDKITAMTYVKDGITAIANRICPRMRIVWNSSDLQNGIVLQMALTGLNTSSEFIKLTDMSGRNSAWELYLNTPNRSNVTTTCSLPSGTTWATGTTGHLASNVVSVITNYTVWQGNIPGSLIDRTEVTLDNLVTSNDIKLDDVKGIQVTVYDRLTQSLITVKSYDLIGTASLVSGYVLYYLPDLCGITVDITHDSTYTLKVTGSSGTNSALVNRFDIRQIDVLH